MSGLPVNILDIIAFAVVVLSGLLALSRGFVREVLAIGAWLGAALMTIYGLGPAKPFLRQYIGSPVIADIATGIGIFVVTLAILSLFSNMVAKQVRGSVFGAADRSLGLLFGLVRGALILCLVFLGFNWLVPVEDRPAWVTEARSLPLIESGAKALNNMLPSDLRDATSKTANDAKTTTDQLLDAERALRSLQQPIINGGNNPNQPQDGQNSDGQASEPAYKDQDKQDLERLIQGTDQEPAPTTP